MTGSILVAGNAKTGTTGVYQVVKSTLRAAGEPCHFLFEPTHTRQLKSLFRYAPDVPVLCKVMAPKLDAARPYLADFEKRVMTVRDPRDTVISTLLFRPMVRWSVAGTEDAALQKFLTALREKEREPSSWSVRALHKLADELGIGSMSWKRQVAQHDAITETVSREDFHVLRYEAFVDGELDELSDYLGLVVENPQAPSADSWLSHISRSRSHGAWRHWFTAEDVERLTPLFERFLRRYGYDPAAPLDLHPTIDPASSSEYVETALAKRRAEVRLRYRRRWSAAGATEEEREQLRQRADDGDVVAAYRVAAIYHRGNDTVAADPDEALIHATRGAVGGSSDAMRLAAEILREQREQARARYWEREAAYLEHEADLEAEARELRVPLSDREASRLLAEARREVEKLRRELSRIRSSTSYRVGVALVRSVRDPRRHAGAAARKLVRAATRRRPTEPAGSRRR